MDKRDLKVVVAIAFVGIAIFAARKLLMKGPRDPNVREVTNGVITWDPVFSKLEPFIAQFHNCLKNAKSDAECVEFFTTDGDVFKDHQTLVAALPVVRSAFQQFDEAEVSKIFGKLLYSHTDRHEVPIFDVDGVIHYKNSRANFNYTIAIQNNALKINRYLIHGSP